MKIAIQMKLYNYIFIRKCFGWYLQCLLSVFWKAHFHNPLQFNQRSHNTIDSKFPGAVTEFD